MTRTTATLIAAILAATLLAGCSSFPHSSDTVINYSGSGDVLEYHANGKVKRKAVYLDGKLVSVVSFYANGAKESNEQYQLGEIHSATYFFRSGRVKTTINGG